MRFIGTALLLLLLTGHYSAAAPGSASDREQFYCRESLENSQRNLDSRLEFLRNRTRDGRLLTRAEVINLLASPNWDRVRADKFLRALMESESKLVLDELRRHPDSYNDFDVVVVGGGVHAAIFNSTLRRLAPDLKTLTVESSGVFAKTFQESADFFFINSPSDQKGKQNTNYFPGSSLQISDLTKERYPTAGHIGFVALFAQMMSGTLTLLNSEVMELKKVRGGYQITLGNGPAIRSKLVVLATGLGRPKDFFDELSFLPAASEKIDTAETFIRKMLRLRDQGIPPLRTLAGERIAVVGAGDSGNVVVEFLLGFGPDSVYLEDPFELRGNPNDRFSDVDRLKKVYWFGQTANSAQDFADQNKERYRNNANMVEDDLIETIPAKLQDVSYSSPEPMKAIDYIKDFFGGLLNRSFASAKPRLPSYNLSFTSTRWGPPEIDKREVDRIIFAGGYENSVADLYARQVWDRGGEIFLESLVSEQGSGRTFAFGKQIFEGRREKVFPTDIYIIGAAAAPLASPAELYESTTGDQSSINVLASRTEEMAFEVAEFFGYE